MQPVRLLPSSLCLSPPTFGPSHSFRRSTSSVAWHGGFSLLYRNAHAPTPLMVARWQNFAAQHSGAIVQKPEGPNTYDLKIWL